MFGFPKDEVGKDSRLF